MSCVNCGGRSTTLAQKLEDAIQKAHKEAEAGTTVAIVPLANGSGYAWRPDGDESIERLGVVRYVRIVRPDAVPDFPNLYY